MGKFPTGLSDGQIIFENKREPPETGVSDK